MRVRVGAALAVLFVAGLILLGRPWTEDARLAALLPGASSPAAGGAAELSGRAVIGPEERPATLRLACDPAGVGLSAILTLPRFAASARGFDGLEGPAGATAILVAAAGGVRSVRVRASAAVAEPGPGFTLTVAGARRGADPLRGIAPALTETGARIAWTQVSPRAGDAPLTATFPVAEAEAVALKGALAGCLPR